MVGKWHLGHGQEKLTPTNKGFHRFTGLYTWDVDPFSKRNFLFPRVFGGRTYLDWLSQDRGKAPYYHAVADHATLAITKESVRYIDEHSRFNSSQPLFMYVSYTAGHSPLIPEPRHEDKCKHIKHLWRRQYCGMVVGVDESIQSIVESIQMKLGNNTVIVFSSDNGGSSWFGG